MSDDLKRFQSDLDMLMAHTRRRLAMLDGLGRFMGWMMSNARDEERMMDHFILPTARETIPASPFQSPSPPPIPDAGFAPEAVEDDEQPAPDQFAPQRPVDVGQSMASLREEMFRRRGD
jgi:hypothetical protein